MEHVFVSYVRENAGEVQRLTDQLVAHGVKVWLERNSIAPGVRWKQAIRKAIHEGAYFIACFSTAYNKKSMTYMNEELTLAIDVLRQRSTDLSWFIPVKLTECEIPDRDIGGGETLQSIQWVDLYQDWDSGIQRILNVIRPTPPGVREQLLNLLPKATSQFEQYLARLLLYRRNPAGGHGDQELVRLNADVTESLLALLMVFPDKQTPEYE
jgi:hypothetical protein